MAGPSGRFFGWVMGGTLPAALAADWLVSAWDQNAGMRDATPGVVTIEDAAARWLLEVLDLPRGSAVGFVTGGTMANFTGLAAGTGHGARRPRMGCRARRPDRRSAGAGASPVPSGTARSTWPCGTSGSASRSSWPATSRAASMPARSAPRSSDTTGPTIVCLQAGNVHSGSFDPFPDAIAAAHEVGAWVHVDGAFGLWAAATPSLASLVDGMSGADSWATDAHKTLNTPYDCGVAIVADAVGDVPRVRAPRRVPDRRGDPGSARARARALTPRAGRSRLGGPGVPRPVGVVDLVDGLVASAHGIAAGIAALPGATIVNDVVYTQVCVAFEDDATTTAVYDAILAEGEIYPSPSRWRDRAVIRISVSNWQTHEAEVATTVAAFERARARSGEPC